MILKNNIINKYKNDKSFSNFIKDYFKIYNIQTSTNTSFELFQQQKDFLEKINSEQFIVCKKSRQIGASKLLSAWILSESLFSNSSETIVYIGINGSIINDIRNQIIDFIENLPLGIFNKDMTIPLIKKHNRQEIIFFNNVKILFKQIDNLDICGLSNVKAFVMEEIAFIDNDKILKILNNIQHYILNNTKLIITSTPNSKNNLFNLLYKLNPTFSLDWWKDPRYNKDMIWIRNKDILIRFDNTTYDDLIENGWKPSSPWYVKMCKSFNNDSQKIAQELDNKFL